MPIEPVEPSIAIVKLSKSQIDEVIEYAISIGIQNAFIQEEGTQEESFIPEFNGEGIV